MTFGKRERDAGQQPSQAQQLLNAQAVGAPNPLDDWVYSKPLQALHINVLREYLEGEFRSLEPAGVLPFDYSFERVIDDFVFMCFFVGNDFLPHLPSLDIRDGAIDFLVDCYKNLLPFLGDYITSPGGIVNLRQVDVLLGRVGEVEDVVFQRRRAAEIQNERRQLQQAEQRKLQQQAGGGNNGGYGRGRSEAFQQQQIQLQQQQQREYLPHPALLPPAGAPPSFPRPPTHAPPPPRPPSLQSRQPPTQPQSQVQTLAQAKAAATKRFEMKMIPLSNNKSAALTLREKILGKRNISDVSTTADAASTTTGASEAASIFFEAAAEGASESEANVIHNSEMESESVVVKKALVESTANESSSADEAAEGNKGAEVNTDADAGADADMTTGVTGLTEDEDDTLTAPEDDVDDEEEDSLVPKIISTVLSAVNVTTPSTPLAAKLSGSENSSATTALLTKKEIEARVKQREQAIIDKYKEQTQDVVKLHEAGWKQRYYDDPPKRDDLIAGGGLERMCRTYIEGLCWVFKYYYEGCPSWNWYYPFHYAPFASDLLNIDRYDIQFELSQPFHPFEQLLAVLPPESVAALPGPCRWLMIEESSPIKDIYASEIPIDPNGKHLPWLWVLLLPFIDEKRVINAYELCKDKLTLEERKRNRFSGSFLFVHQGHRVMQYLQSAETGEPLFEYRADSERDPEILQLIAQQRGQLQKHDELVEDSSSISVTDTLSTSLQMEVRDSVSPTLPAWAVQNASSHGGATFFAPDVGDGICGVVAQPPLQWYAALESRVAAPKIPLLAFIDISVNRVACLSFIFPNERPYDCELLPGYIPKRRVLEPFDIIPKRPPRLNKGFNMMDLHQKMPSYGSSQGHYDQSQQQSYGSLRDYHNSHGPGNNNGGNYSQHSQQYSQQYSQHSQASQPFRHQRPGSDFHAQPYAQQHQFTDGGRYQYNQQPVRSDHTRAPDYGRAAGYSHSAVSYGSGGGYGTGNVYSQPAHSYGRGDRHESRYDDRDGGRAYGSGGGGGRGYSQSQPPSHSYGRSDDRDRRDPRARSDSRDRDRDRGHSQAYPPQAEPRKAPVSDAYQRKATYGYGTASVYGQASSGAGGSVYSQQPSRGAAQPTAPRFSFNSGTSSSQYQQQQQQPNAAPTSLSDIRSQFLNNQQNR